MKVEVQTMIFTLTHLWSFICL